MELSSEEKQLISQRRLEQAISKEQLNVGHVKISIAAQWAEYSKETGFGLSYSEYCGPFNIDERLEDKYRPHRKLIYEGIRQSYSVIDKFSTEIGKLLVNDTHNDS